MHKWNWTIPQSLGDFGNIKVYDFDLPGGNGGKEDTRKGWCPRTGDQGMAAHTVVSKSRMETYLGVLV